MWILRSLPATVAVVAFAYAVVLAVGGGSERCGGVTIEPVEPDPTAPYRNGRAAFSVEVDGVSIPYRLMTVSVLPRQEVELEVLGADRPSVCADRGDLEPIDESRWRWRAPRRPGIESVTIATRRSSIELRMLVLTPYDGRKRVKGFRVGAYEREPLRGDPVYERPRGLFRVDRDDVDLALSPHFRLAPFLSRQTDDFPQYVLVDTRLLLKLELLLERVNGAGIDASTFGILSGYRTPHHHEKSGNTTTYSRHLYGYAADIVIDRNGDGIMDDIDGDGRVTRRDVERLAAILEASDLPEYLPGGLSVSTRARGPFLHVDARGTQVRW
ncbi:MAG: hypothetical protein AAGD38_23800 [Acidobacteriota bacterium]